MFYRKAKQRKRPLGQQRSQWEIGAWKKSGLPNEDSPTETQCALLTYGHRTAPSCSEACGGVISLDPPPPDTTAEPGGNQIVSDSHHLRMMQHKPLVFALHYFSSADPKGGGSAAYSTAVGFGVAQQRSSAAHHSAATAQLSLARHNTTPHGSHDTTPCHAPHAPHYATPRHTTAAA